MIRYATAFAALLFVGACAEVVSENETTFSFEGETYRAVEREFQTSRGGFKKRYIYSRPHPVSCSLTDDRDCISAILISRTRAANR